MSRYDSFHICINEAPETYYQAAVFVNRAFYHIRHQSNTSDRGAEPREILTSAHNRINEELKNRSEYVSTYRGD